MASSTSQLSGPKRQTTVDSRFVFWWEKLLPDQRAAALQEDLSAPLSEWMAQSLLRAGVPLTIIPGFVNGSAAGTFPMPVELGAFLELKRAEGTRRKRFWQRRKH